MANITVNPTRMELTRLKGKLRTAQRGHKLLKDKRDELMKQFLDTVREVRTLRAEVEEELMTVHKSFTVASALMSSEAMEQALLYIRIYFVGIPFMVVCNFGSAVLRSYGDTRRPMYYLIASGVVNVILNLVLVICFHLGVAGVAIATVISNILSTALVLIHLYRRDDEFQFRFEKLHMEKAGLAKVLSIGIPAGIQGAIFSISNVFIQSGINSFGEDAIAGSSLALNFEYFTYDIASAFAQAAVTFTSQNFGAGNLKRCKKIFWLCMAFGIGFTEVLSIIFMIWDNFFVSIYTTSQAVAVYGLIRMHRVCALEGVTATYEVGSAALRGMGKSVEPSVITILGTVVFRMIWMVTIFKWFPTFDMLMNVYIASWDFYGGGNLYRLPASYEEVKPDVCQITLYDV